MVEIPLDYHDILDKKAFVHLATKMKDGSPQVSPVWAERDGNTIHHQLGQGPSQRPEHAR